VVVSSLTAASRCWWASRTRLLVTAPALSERWFQCACCRWSAARSAQGMTGIRGGCTAPPDAAELTADAARESAKGRTRATPARNRGSSGRAPARRSVQRDPGARRPAAAATASAAAAAAAQSAITAKWSLQRSSSDHHAVIVDNSADPTGHWEHLSRPPQPRFAARPGGDHVDINIPRSADKRTRRPPADRGGRVGDHHRAVGRGTDGHDRRRCRALRQHQLDGDGSPPWGLAARPSNRCRADRPPTPRARRRCQLERARAPRERPGPRGTRGPRR